MRPCVRATLGGVRTTAVSDFCSIQFTRQLHCVHFLNCPSPVLPLLSPIPISALSPPSRRPLRSHGRSLTLQSFTWLMSPSTASWRNILQHWSCSTPPVSNTASWKKSRGWFHDYVNNLFFFSMYCYIIVKINILSSESTNTFSSILCQIPHFRNWTQGMFGILKNNLNNQIIIEIMSTNFHLIVLYNTQLILSTLIQSLLCVVSFKSLW